MMMKQTDVDHEHHFIADFRAPSIHPSIIPQKRILGGHADP